MTKIVRCEWIDRGPLYLDYHDNEWGYPMHDDKDLFRQLCIQGFQAGLSWDLVLKRKAKLDEAFDNFDPDKIIKYDDKKLLKYCKLMV